MPLLGTSVAGNVACATCWQGRSFEDLNKFDALLCFSRKMFCVLPCFVGGTEACLFAIPRSPCSQNLRRVSSVCPVTCHRRRRRPGRPQRGQAEASRARSTAAAAAAAAVVVRCCRRYAGPACLFLRIPLSSENVAPGVFVHRVCFAIETHPGAVRNWSV